MACNNFGPVFTCATVFGLEEQPPLAIAKPELRLASQRFDRLRTRTINSHGWEFGHRHTTGLVPKIIASTSALATAARPFLLRRSPRLRKRTLPSAHARRRGGGVPKIFDPGRGFKRAAHAAGRPWRRRSSQSSDRRGGGIPSHLK